MDDSKIENLINECKRIEGDSKYTAEAHHQVARSLSCKAFWCKAIPAVTTVGGTLLLLIGSITFSGSPNWVAWITLLSGTVTMFNVFMEPEKRAGDHVFAAKAFTVLKHDARSLHESFRDFMNSDEFHHNVRLLREKYNWLVQGTPPTDDQRAWDKARQRIKSGVHEPDVKSEPLVNGRK
ncbi:MAG: SLATT domain-containing protein [Candidatus Omnitrophica bacterium]|nr:SLATT domain-containing protein [Candidatus Omnitrophota bacterium]